MDYKYGKPVQMNDLKRSISWRLQSTKEIKNYTGKFAIIGKRTSCPICENRQGTAYITVNANTYLECSNCGHLYMEDIISDMDTCNLYSQDSSYSDMYANDAFFQKRIDMISAPKVEFVKKYLNDFPIGSQNKQKEWLDIGCAACELLVAAKQAGFCVKGIEPGQIGVTQGKRFNIPVQQIYLSGENASEIIGDADIISIINTFEHVPNPQTLFHSIASAAHKNAFIVIEVPRHPSLSAFTASLFPQDVARHLVPYEHIHIFTEKSLNILVEKNGFEIVKMWKFGQDFYELLSVLTLKADKEIDCWPEELFISINDVQKALDSNGLSDCMYVIAQHKK